MFPYEFQHIDPEDKAAVAVLNSCTELIRPAHVSEGDWIEFLQWQGKILLKRQKKRRTGAVGVRR